jgi:hypothetical protein
MNALSFLLLLQVVAAPPRPAPQFTVQMGSKVTPDTVTVGQRFVLLLKVRAPTGATIQFPAGIDSSVATTPTAPQIIGAPLLDSVPDATGTTRTAAYRFTAWDIGVQRLGLGNIAVTLNGKTEYVSLATQSVFVRSVLPADTTQRQPKPLRPPIVLVPFNWWPWLALLAAILLALLAWWLYRWLRRRRERPLPPFETAEREFARIEAMKLIEAGESERYVALMTDTMRDYLSARVENIQRSQTSAELMAAATAIHPYAPGLAHLLSRADMVKFARERVSPDEARALGGQARSIVRQVEDHFIALEKATAEKRAA